MTKYKKYKRLTASEKKEVVEKHFEKRISQAQLAKEYDTNRTTISRLCRENGKSPLIKNYKMDEEKIIYMYTNEKKSVLQIATILGTTTNPITRRLRIAGIEKKVSRRSMWEKTIPHYFLRLKIWTARVIEADGMKCQMCGCENTRENRLEANHIVPVRDIENPELLFDLDNGITLCRKDHLKIHYHEKEYETFFRNLIRTRSSV